MKQSRTVMWFYVIILTLIILFIWLMLFKQQLVKDTDKPERNLGTILIDFKNVVKGVKK